MKAMNDRFDKLAEGLAQSLTRRQAIRRGLYTSVRQGTPRPPTCSGRYGFWPRGRLRGRWQDVLDGKLDAGNGLAAQRVVLGQCALGEVLVAGRLAINLHRPLFGPHQPEFRDVGFRVDFSLARVQGQAG